MRDIYKNAERVLIWLGLGTEDTDFIMATIQEVHKQTINVPGDWRRSTEHTWPIRRHVLLNQIHSTAPKFPGLQVFWQRPWFDRIWVIQEIANARTTMIVCGNKSVSAKTFALVPSIVGEHLEPHCQAVLDIMPGLSRAESWWNNSRDLHTLLVKFGASQATDERDKVYALLGISSDAADNDIFQIDYSKSPAHVLRDTISFLVFREILDHTIYRFPYWGISDIAKKLGRLKIEFFDWAINQGQTLMLQRLRLGSDTKSMDHAEHMQFQQSMVTSGQELLRKAAAEGNEEVIRTVLAQTYIDINSKDTLGRSPLHLAAENSQTAVIMQLLAHENIETNCRDGKGQTPLFLAVARGHEAVVSLFLAREEIDVNCKDSNGRTPLLLATGRGHVATVELLLANQNIDVNCQDTRGRTPLLIAVGKGHEVLLKQLLKHEKILLDRRDNDGQIPLSLALRHGNQQTARCLIARMEMTPDCEDRNYSRHHSRLGKPVRKSGKSGRSGEAVLTVCALTSSEQRPAAEYYVPLRSEFQSIAGPCP